MNISFVTLRLFISAYEEMSITKAAEREGIAPSALSKRLSDLEATLKVALFHRGAKGLEPTAAAQALLRHARTVVRELENLNAELLEHQQGLKGTVRIHSNLWPILQYLPEELASFMALHPMVHLEVEESVSPASIRAVENNLADIGIIGSNVPAPGLEVMPFRVDRLVAVVPCDHELSRRESVRVADLVPFQLIGAKQGSSLDELVQRALSLLPRPPKLRIRVTGFETACRMVEARLGMALAPQWCVSRYSPVMKIVAVPLNEPWAVRGLSLCFAPRPSRQPLVDELVNHLSRSAPSPNEMPV